MDLRWLDSTFVLEFYESLVRGMVWSVAGVFLTEILCIVILILGKDPDKDRRLRHTGI